MRATANPIYAVSKSPNGRAIVYYEDADTSALPSTTGYPLSQSPDNNGCTNEDLSLTLPSCAMAVEDPGTTLTVNINVALNSSRVAKWEMNGVSFEGDYNVAILAASSPAQSDLRTGVECLQSRQRQFGPRGRLQPFPRRPLNAPARPRSPVLGHRYEDLKRHHHKPKQSKEMGCAAARRRQHCGGPDLQRAIVELG